MVTPKRKDAQQLTELILDTARDLFTKFGVDSVSMHQIAKAAGVGQATLYRRYTQKGDLCLELIDDHFNRFKNDIEQLLASIHDQPVLDRLKAVFRRLVVFASDETALLKAIHISLVHNRCIENDKRTFFTSPPYMFLHSTLTHLLKESQDSGQTVPFDPAFTAHIYIASLAPFTLQHLSEDYGMSTDAIVEQLLRTLICPLFKPNNPE
ncbi:TetR/AcrR family transcriptional regulator [Paenibacillus kobensis]|uniref:TetR/AcrR family transcriptional regulator n=1 Tax=Paenibacillus kobensis TaxID=59841 RepID=UPI000FD709EB|nr:TetR/AcrR family transcriptional regulator [Paenibacillus kobensis]